LSLLPDCVLEFLQWEAASRGPKRGSNRTYVALDRIRADPVRAAPRLLFSQTGLDWFSGVTGFAPCVHGVGGPDHNVVNECVYNIADIAHLPVVWARGIGAEKNKELLEYFKDRRVWLVEPDEDPPRLSPYPTELRSTATAIQVPAGFRRADR
jgi:hypothetical protein